jgi:hypothetical protein
MSKLSLGLTKHYAMRTDMGVDVWILFFLYLGVGWRMSGHLLAPAALTRGLLPLYPLGRGLGGPQSWSGH